MTSQPVGYVLVQRDRAEVYINMCRILVYGLCAGGMAMGVAVMRADALRSAQYTALSDTPGWPESWGLTLALLGFVSLLSRPMSRLVGRRAANAVAAAAMAGMSVWYVVFASSLILGTASYGQFPYLTLAAMHGGFSYLVWRTNGFRSSTPGV